MAPDVLPALHACLLPLFPSCDLTSQLTETTDPQTGKTSSDSSTSMKDISLEYLLPSFSLLSFIYHLFSLLILPLFSFLLFPFPTILFFLLFLSLFSLPPSPLSLLPSLPLFLLPFLLVDFTKQAQEPNLSGLEDPHIAPNYPKDFPVCIAASHAHRASGIPHKGKKKMRGVASSQTTSLMPAGILSLNWTTHTGTLTGLGAILPPKMPGL